jgi:PAS domain S-box-containing protein
MSEGTTDFSIHSLQDAVTSLPPGAQLVISLHPGEYSTRITTLLAKSLKRKHRLVFVPPSSSTAGSERRRRRNNVNAFTTAEMRRLVAKTPRTAILIVDTRSEENTWWIKAADRGKVFRNIGGITSRKKIRTVWMLSPRQVSREEMCEIKDAAEFFIQFAQIGSLRYAQFLAAKGFSDPGFFLPRSVLIEDDMVRIEAPTFPSVLPTHEHGGEATVHDSLGDQYRQFFENSPDGILVFDTRTHYREANQRLLEMLGLTKEEFQHLVMRAVVPASSMRTALRALALLYEKGRATGRLELTRKSGRTFTTDFSGSTLRKGMYLVSLRDVTGADREESTLRQEAYERAGMMENLPHAVAVFANRRLSFSNRQFRETFAPVLQRLARPTLTEVLGKQNNEVVRKVNHLLDIEHGEDIVRLTVEVSISESAILMFELSAIRTLFEGKPALQITLVDCTDRAQRFRELKESEERYRRLVHHSPDAIAIERDGRIVAVNSAFLGMFGYEHEDDILGKSLASVGVPKSERLQHGTDKPGDGSVVTRVEFKAKHKHGESLLVEAAAIGSSLNGSHERVWYFHDVTGRKRFETELEHAVADNAFLQDAALSVHRSLNAGDVMRASLDVARDATRFPAGALCTFAEDSRSVNINVHHDLSENVLKALSAQSADQGLLGYVVKTHEPLILFLSDYPAHIPYKSLWENEGFQTIVLLPLVTNDAVKAVLLLASPKTAPPEHLDKEFLSHVCAHLALAVKNAQEFHTLEDREKQFRASIEGVSGVVYRAAPNGKLEFISRAIEELSGYSQAEFYRSPDLWRTIMHPDDRPQYSRRITNQSERKDTFVLEYRILPKGKATYKRVQDSIRYTRGESGDVTAIHGILGANPDEESGLSFLSEINADALENAPAGLIVFDNDLRPLLWNKTMEELTHVTRDEVLGKDTIEKPEGLEGALRPLVTHALEGLSVSSEELSFKPVNSETDVDILVQCAPLKKKDGGVRGAVAIVTDMTDRRKLEREVRESEETLRNVIDAMGDALMISDLQGRVWEVNREFSRITGYPRGEVQGMSFPYPWLMEEEMARFVTWIAALRDKTYLRDFDMTWRSKDGHQVAISLNTTLLRNAYGEPMALLNIARDISDRKRLALEVERKNKQIELLNRIISKGNSTIDFHAIFATIASEVLQLVQYDQISVGILSDDQTSMTLLECSSPTGKTFPLGALIPIETTVSKLALADRKAVIIGNLKMHKELGPETQSIAEGFLSQISIPVFLKDRILGTLNIASVAEHAFTGREVEFLQPIADQIGAMIDRVQLFQRVSDDSKYIHNLLNSIDSVVFTVDDNYRITEVNKAWREYARRHGLDQFIEEQSVVGQELKEIITPDLWQTCSEVMPQLFSGSLDYFAREFELPVNDKLVTYRMAINPMVINEKVTGLVFTSTDITEIKRTEEEVKRRNKELFALNNLSGSINKSLDLTEVLRVSSEGIKGMISADAVLFYLRGDGSDELHLSFSDGVDEESATQIRTLPIGASATGRAVKDRKAMIIGSGLSNDARITAAGRNSFARAGFCSMAAIPIQSKDNVLGALDVVFKKDHDFTEQEQQLLLLIGNQIGSAIENAQLYAQVQAQVQRLTSLYELGKSLTGELDLKRMLHTVYKEVAKTIPLDCFRYRLYDSASQKLSTLFDVVDGEPVYHERESDREEYLVEDGSPMNDIIVNGKPYIGSSPFEKETGFSVLAVPIRSQGKIAGMISVHKKGANAYNESHLRLLQNISNLSEIAADKASLYQDTVRKSEEIEERNRELDDFTYVVSHDLKEPLISIEGYSKILLKDYEASIDPEGHEYLSTVVQSTSRMKSLIDDLLTLSRLGRVADKLDDVSVGDVVKEILHDLQFTLQERNIAVTIPPAMPDVKYNATQLTMVFRNLIVNAMKFNDKPRPTITLDVKENETEFVFSVADNGIGISKDYFDKIFLIFQRLQRSEEYRGTGAGLTIVKKIIEKHRGRIWVDSVLGEGTTFFFTIPK